MDAKIMLAHRGSAKGLSLIEIMVVLAISILLAAMAVPTLESTLQDYRAGGDARDLSSELSMAKMRAAADFTQTRLYANLATQSFEVDRWTGGAWSSTESGTQAISESLSNGVTFGFGSVATSPSGIAIAQAPLCANSTNTGTVANTACVIFNSRGVPVDSTGTPIATDAIYVTDGSSVYGVTVLASGLIQTWRSEASAAGWKLR